MRAGDASAGGRQLVFAFGHEPRFVAADFLAAASNADALAWLAPGAEWSQGRLALWGPEGSGKTHLLHLWAERTGARLLAGPSLPREMQRAETPVAIDDADTAAERPLLHLLNTWAEAGQRVLLAARMPPARWAVGLPDLASRVRAATAVEIRPPDDDLLQKLLAKLMADRQVTVAEPVQEFLLQLLPRTAGAVREAAARLDRATLLARRPATKALAAEIARSIAGGSGANDEDFAAPAPPASTAAPCLL